MIVAGSRYYILQYVPEQWTDERINFGLAVCDDTGVRYAWTADMERIRVFARKQDVSFLLRVAQDFEQNCTTREKLDEVSGNWHNSVQVTQGLGSTRSGAELMETIRGKVLGELTP